MIDFKGHRFEKDLILLGVRGDLAYPLSYRNREERREECGGQVDHSKGYRGVQKFTPPWEAAFRQGRKRPVSKRWRRDETDLKSKGQGKSLYRAVDKAGQPLDFLLTAHRGKKPVRRFFKNAIRPHGLPATVTIDKSGANTVALEVFRRKPVTRSQSVRASS